MTSFSCRLIALNLLLALCVLGVASQTKLPTSQVASNSPIVAQAQALLRAGKFDAAIDLLRSLPRSSANDTTVSHLLGLAYYQKGDYARTIEHLSIAVKQEPEGISQYRQGV